MPQITIIASEWFNALYTDGALLRSGKPEYLHAETLVSLHPDAALYSMGQDVYDELLDGNDYPQSLEQVPLTRLERLR